MLGREPLANWVTAVRHNINPLWINGTAPCKIPQALRAILYGIAACASLKISPWKPKLHLVSAGWPADVVLRDTLRFVEAQQEGQPHPVDVHTDQSSIAEYVQKQWSSKPEAIVASNEHKRRFFTPRAKFHIIKVPVTMQVPARGETEAFSRAGQQLINTLGLNDEGSVSSIKKLSFSGEPQRIPRYRVRLTVEMPVHAANAEEAIQRARNYAWFDEQVADSVRFTEAGAEEDYGLEAMAKDDKAVAAADAEAMDFGL